MSTYLIYARVSPRGSTWAASESSVPVQIRACREYVLRVDPTASFIEVTDEFESGKDTRRPGFRRIQGDLQAMAGDWECLVVYSIDRIGRSLADMLPFFEAMHKAGRGLLAVRQNIDMNTAGGRAMLYMLCVFAQLEREMNSERTTVKMVSIAAAGGIPYGRAPYGYRRTPKSNVLSIDPEPAARVRQCFDFYAAGRPLGEIMTATGLPKSSVMQILRRRIYAGTIEYGGQTFPGRHVPLVSQDLWDRANARLPRPAAADRPAGRPNARTFPYLLAGLVHCHCGRAMTPYSVLKSTRRGKVRYHYYKCTDPACRSAVSAPSLDRRVLEHCRANPITEQTAAVLVDELRRIRAERLKASVPRLRDLDIELAAARRRLKVADDAFFGGLVTAANAAHWNAAMAEARHQVEELESEQRALASLTAAPDASAADVVERLRYWGALLDRMDTDDSRRAFVQAHVTGCTVTPDRRVSVRLVMTNGTDWQPR